MSCKLCLGSKRLREMAFYIARPSGWGLPQTQLGGEADKATVNDFSCHIQLTSDLFYNIKMYFLKISTFQKSYFVVSM